MKGHWKRRFTGTGIVLVAFVAHAAPAAATMTASPNPVSFGNVFVGTQATLDVTVSTDTTHAMVSSGITGAGASSFSADSTCTTNANGQCTIRVTFEPIARGTRSATLTLSRDTAETISVPLQGVGVAPVASVSPAALPFGNRHVGTQSTLNVIVSNTGDQVLTVNSATVIGADAFTIGPGTCGTFPSNVPPSGSCQISVAFAPASVGSKTATLTVSSNDPVNPTRNVSLSGTGTSPTVNVSGGPLGFGGQSAGTQSAPMVVTVANDPAASEAAVVTAALGGANAADFAITSNGCTGAIAPGGSCQVSVAFGPASGGAKAASLDLSTNDPANPSTSVSLSGTGTIPIQPIPIVSTPAGPLAFGAQHVGTQSSPLVVTVANDAAANANATISAALSGADASDFTITSNGCAAAVAPGGSCDVAVAFAPGSEGEKSASLDITSNDPGNPSDTIALSGAGTSTPSTADTDPPETTITKAPARKTSKRRATFEFTSDEDGSTFQCSLDGHAFAPCSSPTSLRLKRGKHSFEARATDVAGNPDATPAQVRWRVKRKRP